MNEKQFVLICLLFSQFLISVPSAVSVLSFLPHLNCHARVRLADCSLFFSLSWARVTVSTSLPTSAHLFSFPVISLPFNLDSRVFLSCQCCQTSLSRSDTLPRLVLNFVSSFLLSLSPFFLHFFIIFISITLD